MARFVFELEAVLTQRRNAEKACQRVVAEAERERVGLENELRALQQAIETERRDLSERLSPGQAGSPLAYRAQANASLHLTVLAQRKAIELAGALKRLDAARARLREAATGRKAIERLKERRLEEWRDEQKRLEHNALDELSVMRASRADNEWEGAA